MPGKSDLIHIQRKTILRFLALIIVLAVATPVLADYLGPNRTVTETTSVCKIVLYECKYVASKDAWRYHKTEDWSCSNEGKPWQAYSDTPSSQGCFSATEGDRYWQKEEQLQTVTVTYPEAIITPALQDCTSYNGWCNTSPQLTLNAVEPVSGYTILAVEGSLNGQTFACSGSNCNVPLNEGENAFTFWALSSWGDSSALGTFTSKVDTVPPTLGLDVTASNGTAGWYTSPAMLSVTGSDSTSGLASVLLSVDNGAWESSATLNEGVYTVDVQAEDYAGNIATSSTTISVDTTTPTIDLALNGITGNNGWYISDMEVTAYASDATSGIGLFEVSTDSSAYVNYQSPITFADGYHTVQFKATDKAGNKTETTVQEFFIDTIAPVIDLPATWNVDETITYKVQDDGSGLSALRVVIEDEDEKYAKVAWNESVSGNKFKGEITWNGKFKDGTVAPPGEYLVWVKTSDMAGNETVALGIVTVPSPFSLFQPITAASTPAALPTPPKELFEEEVIPPASSSAPITTFGNATSQPKETESASFAFSPKASGATSSTTSNVLWGATAAAIIGAATAYALDERKKRKEAEAQQRAQVQAQVDAFNAAQAAQRQAKWQAQKALGWLEGQAILNAQIEEAKKQGATDKEIAELKLTGAQKGFGAAIQKAEETVKTLFTQNLMRQQALNAFRAQERDSAAAEAWKQRADEKQKAEDLQAGLAAYYSAMRQGEQVAAYANALQEKPSFWKYPQGWLKEKVAGLVRQVKSAITPLALSAPASTQHTPHLAIMTAIPVANVKEDNDCGFLGYKCWGKRLREWWNETFPPTPKTQSAPDVNAIQTQIVQTVVAQFTQTAQATTPTPMTTPTYMSTPSATAMPGIPMFVLADGLNLRTFPGLYTRNVLEESVGSIPRGGQIYINQGNQPIIQDGFCWSQATYKDPKVNATAVPIADNFLDPLAEFIRRTDQGAFIDYSNAVPGWENKHIGNDLMPLYGGEPNPTIVASASGVVIRLGTQAGGGGYGNYVIIEYPASSLLGYDQYIEDLKDGKSLYAIYGHLQNLNGALSQGTEVSAGTNLGTMGTTGNSSEVHLHIELRAGQPGQTGLTADTGDWYNATKLVPIDPAKLITPTDTFEGWVAMYQCDGNGMQIGESYLGGTP